MEESYRDVLKLLFLSYQTNHVQGTNMRNAQFKVIQDADGFNNFLNFPLSL